MSINELMDHKCDIYHLIEAPTPVGYGLPQQLNYEYPKEPNEKGVDCHFKSLDKMSILPSEPQRVISQELTLILLPNTPIKFNDKIVNKETGLSYYAQKPINIRNTYIRVVVATNHKSYV